MNIEKDNVDGKYYVWTMVDHQNEDGTWGAHSEELGEFNTRQEAEEFVSQREV